MISRQRYRRYYIKTDIILEDNWTIISTFSNQLLSTNQKCFLAFLTINNFEINFCFSSDLIPVCVKHEETLLCLGTVGKTHQANFSGTL